MIFDASVYKANEEFGDPFHFLKLQIVWILAGALIATIIYFWDYRKLQSLSSYFSDNYHLTNLSTILGEDINGAKRWFAIGPLPPIQPAELAKVGIILYLSSWMSTNKYFQDSTKVELKGSFLQTLISFGAIVGIVALLIILEPDLGTTMIIGLTSFTMFFVAKNGWDHTKYTLGSLLLLGIPLSSYCNNTSTVQARKNENLPRFTSDWRNI